MSFRTVMISNTSKLNYKNRYLVVKQETDEKYVHLSEIDTLIIDSISVSISSYLLKEIIDNKINIIFCDEKHNPHSELISLHNSHNSTKKVLEQINWKNKDLLWKSIVINKIINQSMVLNYNSKDKYDLLLTYTNEVKIGDKSNREGHAAKVYFNSLFGNEFKRNNNDNINDALNYGYAVLLSTVSKEIVSLGYLTQLGIHHKNEFNDYNLSCDLMEVFRPIIDDFVYRHKTDEFNKEYRLKLLNLFNDKCKYNNKFYTIKDIIKFYVKDTLSILDGNKIYSNFIYEK